MSAALNRIRMRLRVFEDAVRADEFKGGGDPADIPAIEDELRIAETELLDLIESYLK